MNSIWTIIQLQDVCEFENGDRGKNYPGRKALVSHGIPFINAGHITPRGVSLDKMDFIPEEQFDLLNSGKVRDGDIIFCLRGSLGKFAVINGIKRGAIASSLVIVRPKANIDIRFLAAYFGSGLCTHMIELFANGVAQPNLSVASLKKFEIPLPPLEEQKRIAAILDKADSLLVKRRAALAKLDALVQSVFLEMFGDPVTNPMGWPLNELDVVCKEIYRYPTFYGIDYVENGTPVVRIGNILANGMLDPQLSAYVFIDSEKSKQFPRTILNFHDIVMAVRGDGSTASRIGLVASKNLIGANMSPNLLRFHPDSNYLNPIYLFSFMTSVRGQHLLQSHVTRTAKKTITARDIKRIKVPIPPLYLQTQFLNAIERLDSLRNTYQYSLKKSDNLFHSLQQRAFRGEL